MIAEIQITKQALKDLKKAPLYIQEKFRGWLIAVNTVGVEEVKKRPGWHDEQLVGDRKNQRSIRLNKQWRAIYIIRNNGQVAFIEIKEVTPHEY